MSFSLLLRAHRQFVVSLLLFLYREFFTCYITLLCIIRFESLQLVSIICCIIWFISNKLFSSKSNSACIVILISPPVNRLR